MDYDETLVLNNKHSDSDKSKKSKKSKNALVVLLIVGRKIADAFPNYLKSRQKKFFETTSVYCLSFIHSGKKYLRCCYATCLAKNRFVDTFFRRRHFYLPTIYIFLP